MQEKFNQSFNIHKSIDILVFLVNSVLYEGEKSNNFPLMADNVLHGFVTPVNKILLCQAQCKFMKIKTYPYFSNIFQSI